MTSGKENPHNLDLSNPANFKIPDQEQNPLLCKYWEAKSNPNIKDPHLHLTTVKTTRPKISESLIDLVGRTPLVRLNKVPQKYGVKADILLKLEGHSPTGSVKDKTTLYLIEGVQRTTVLNNDKFLIESSSGNTAVAAASLCAVKQLNFHAFMRQKFSNEKAMIVRAFGFEVTILSDIAPMFHELGDWGSCLSREREQPEKYYFLNQHNNPANAIAHYDTTGIEILKDTQGKIDYLVGGSGTGGTMNGITKRFIDEGREDIKVINADPVGSRVTPGLEHEYAPWKVEGVGLMFKARNVDLKNLHEYVRVPDKNSFDIAREVVETENIPIGSSSGTALWAAIQYCLDNSVEEGKVLVVVCPDTSLNYNSSHMQIEWMIDMEYTAPYHTLLNEYSVAHLLTALTSRNPNFMQRTSLDFACTLKESLALLTSTKQEYAAVVKNSSEILGTISLKELLTKIVNRELQSDTTVNEVKKAKYRTVTRENSLSYVICSCEVYGFVMLEEEPNVVITQEDLGHFMLTV